LNNLNLEHTLKTKTNKSDITNWLKNRATELGFEACGIAKAGFLEDEAPRLEKWLKAGMHGEMRWMENHFEKRHDPTKLVDGAKSVVVLLHSYFPEKEIPAEDNYIISKYAYGKDYHLVIKEKQKRLLQELSEKSGSCEGRVFVDSAPVLERAWAVKAGLGWIGKNGCLIVPGKGSYFFISEIITNLNFDYDPPLPVDFCGSCRKCIDACPTKALIAPRILDARKCISYLTIESKNEIPDEFKGKFSDRIFGCDICQDVCPWNRFSKPNSEKDFHPSPALQQMTKKDWAELTEESFENLFGKSAVKRTKYKGLMRNIDFIKLTG